MLTRLLSVFSSNQLPSAPTALTSSHGTTTPATMALPRAAAHVRRGASLLASLVLCSDTTPACPPLCLLCLLCLLCPTADADVVESRRAAFQSGTGVARSIEGNVPAAAAPPATEIGLIREQVFSSVRLLDQGAISSAAFRRRLEDLGACAIVQGSCTLPAPAAALMRLPCGWMDEYPDGTGAGAAGTAGRRVLCFSRQFISPCHSRTAAALCPPPLPGVRPTHEIERLIQLQDKNGTARFRVRFARAVPASTIA